MRREQRAAVIAADVEKLTRQRPWVVVALSTWEPYEPVVMARVETAWVARNVALDYVDAGFLDVHAENEHTRDVWYPPARTSQAVTA